MCCAVKTRFAAVFGFENSAFLQQTVSDVAGFAIIWL
jgi:hypothetical protein